jgi:dolichol-phosphate mannosyltransferase
MKNDMKFTIIIPSLNPNEKLLKLVNELLDFGFNDIIVVNDGSGRDYNKIFDMLPSKVKLIKNDVNKGKGESLKSAISILDDTDAFITVDADGQHRIKDVIKVKNALKENDVVLGIRNFDLENVPRRNRFGNKISSLVFRLKTGIKLNDTQTGLRGINIKYKDLCLSTKGSRYEYEMNFLYNLAKNKIKISTVDINTVYDEDNESHFNPIKDSLLIHKWIIWLIFIIIVVVIFIIIK